MTGGRTELDAARAGILQKADTPVNFTGNARLELLDGK